MRTYSYTTGALGSPTGTVTYTYGNANWGDLLTKVSTGTNTFTYDYDEIGNLESDGTWTYEWQHGRQLKSMSSAGATWNFTYNAEGLRTRRTTGTTTYEYIYNGSQLSQMDKGTESLYFAYDAAGSPMALTYDANTADATAGTVYYYITNIQGDVIGITDSSGNTVVTYTYDAWGNPLATTDSTTSLLGTLNPLRYRGYVYDQETGLYYLQSRYYNSEIGRFISADAQFDKKVGLLGHNLFSYCANSPIVYKDDSGFAVDTILDIASAVFSLIEFVGNPAWSTAGYLAWDVASAFIPLIPGSYVAKGTKIVIKIGNKIDDLADSAKFLTGTYKKLKKVFKGIDGIEIHHLIEKRFRDLFSCKAGDFLSIPLTSDLHQVFTNRWRNLPKIDDIFKNFGYGGDYSQITYDLMVQAVKEVYYDVPELLDEVLTWLEKSWKGN